jgi:hypothetical protein
MSKELATAETEYQKRLAIHLTTFQDLLKASEKLGEKKEKARHKQPEEKSA